MEKQIKIKSPDNHCIYGTWRSANCISKNLIIFVHGLTGNRNEHLFFNGADFFATRGFDSFRFDLYSGEKGGRNLSQVSLSIHAADLNQVVKYFRKKYQNIFVIGHSLGALVILRSEIKKIDGIIFWDGSGWLGPNLKKYLQFNKKLRAYILSWGCDYVINKKLVEDLNQKFEPQQLAGVLTEPFKVIAAGKGILVKTAKEYFAGAKGLKEMSIIKKATHCFDEEGVEKELFEETLSFLKRTIK